MAFVSTPGLLYPPLPLAGFSSGFAAGNLLINAAGEKIAKSGRIWWPGATVGQTKNITKVAFRWGAITKAGGSGLTLSLQDVSLTAGPYIQPDGTQDQTVAIANGDAGFASNTWYKTNALSAVRTVSFGDLVSCVWEWDGGGRLGADSVVVNTFNGGSASATESSARYTGGVWGSVSQSLMNILFEFDDGTFGSFRSGYPGASNYSVVLISPAGTPNEWAQKIVVPFKCIVDGIVAYAYTSAGSTGDFTLSIEDGSGTVLAGPITFDYNAMISANFGSYQRPSFSPITLNAGDTVYICCKPVTSGQSVTVSYADVNHFDHWQAWQFGDANINAASRKDGGAWTQTTTRRLDFHLQVQKIDDGAGGAGGGLLTNPGMRGGML